MPTFFSRRYQRGKPSSDERAIGVAILLLVVLLVGTFLLTSGLLQNTVRRFPVLSRAKAFIGLDERPLFVAEPGSAKPPTPSADERTAALMLPDGIQGWIRRVVKSYKAMPAGSESWEALRAAFKAQPKCVYFGGYQIDGGKPAASVLITDCGDVEKARTLYRSRAQQTGKTLQIGSGGQIVERKVKFWAGRYYTELESNTTPESLESLARGIAQQQLVYADTPAPQPSEGAAATQPAAGATAAAKPAAARFPDVGEGIEPPAKIERYTDNLYEKIDGREGQYRSFHFVELRFGQYQDTRKQQAFDVYLYDMGEPVNAMGIHASERSGSSPPLDVGHDGYVSGVNAYFWKGKYYVNVLGPADAGEDAAETTRKIATAIGAGLPEDRTTFWADDLLPKEDRLPNTFKFRATSALGYDFLENMYLADYETAGKKYSMFVLKAADPAAAKSLFEKLAEATAKYDKVVSRQASDGGETLVGESLGIFSCAFYRGQYLAGVVECDDQALAVKQAGTLRDRIGKEGSSGK